MNCLKKSKVQQSKGKLYAEIPVETIKAEKEKRLSPVKDFVFTRLGCSWNSVKSVLMIESPRY